MELALVFFVDLDLALLSKSAGVGYLLRLRRRFFERISEHLTHTKHAKTPNIGRGGSGLYHSEVRLVAA